MAETDLELEKLLEIGKGLAWHQHQVVADELFRRLFRTHDDLEERVDTLNIPRDVARVTGR